MGLVVTDSIVPSLGKAGSDAENLARETGARAG